MSARKWLLAVVAVFGLASAAWAQGPGGCRPCCGGGMQGGGGQGMMRGCGGPGMMTGNPMQYQQMQQMQMQQLQRQVAAQQLQAQMTANWLANATAVGRANHARQMAAARNAQLLGGK